MNDNAASTAVDDSMDANEGTSSANTNTMSVAGKINTALEFVAASSEYVDLGDPVSLQVAHATYAMWIKTTQSGGMCFYYNDDSSDRHGFYITTYARWNVTAGGNAEGPTGDITVNDGEWHHIVGTYDGTTLKLYVDGVLKASNL